MSLNVVSYYGVHFMCFTVIDINFSSMHFQKCCLNIPDTGNCNGKKIALALCCGIIVALLLFLAIPLVSESVDKLETTGKEQPFRGRSLIQGCPN